MGFLSDMLTMSEIERAIETLMYLQYRIEDLSGEELLAIGRAVTAIKEKLDREKNPLTCDGCDNKDKFDYSREVGRPCPCTHCKRIAPDRYEPKGEKA